MKSQPESKPLDLIETIKFATKQLEGPPPSTSSTNSTDNMEDDDDFEKCPECGHTPETGACFYCKMD